MHFEWKVETVRRVLRGRVEVKLQELKGVSIKRQASTAARLLQTRPLGNVIQRSGLDLKGRVGGKGQHRGIGGGTGGRELGDDWGAHIGADLNGRLLLTSTTRNPLTAQISPVGRALPWYVYVFVYTYVSLRVCVRVRVSVSMYGFTCLCMCTCMYACYILRVVYLRTNIMW